MKKFILGFLILLIPTVCYASDYDIKNYYIDVDVLENGDMDVTELIIMKGTFNGYEIGIDIDSYSEYGASDLVLNYVGGKTDVVNPSWDTLNEDFSEFKKVTSASSGDILKYVQVATNKYRLYYKTSNSTTAFLIKYTLKDVAILHNDCVEIYWNFFSEDFRDDIKNFEMKVHIPKNIDLNDFHYWFHGMVSGNSDYSNGEILATLKDFDAYTPLDFRILLDTDLFESEKIKKTDSKNVVEEIIEEEDEIVAHDLAEIKRVRFLYYTAVGLTIIYFVIQVIVLIYVYIKYDKERKPKFYGKYNREFIDDYDVEVIDYLMNKNVTPNAMSASIMNLIYKKNIKYEEIADSKKKNYKFIIVNRDNLSETESKLVTFLFDKIGNGEEFTTEQLKKYANSTSTGARFLASFTSWKYSVISDGEKQEFFETQTGKGKFAIFMVGFAFIISLFTFLYSIEFIPAYATLVISLLFAFYVVMFNKKTEKGIEHYAKWKAFKNFLDDFGAFQLKELPEVILWERYLVYATIFGLATKVQKAMNVRINELDIDTVNADMIYMPNINIAPIINNSINTAYNNAHLAVSKANASASGGSFGGHGGGFSSGGGSGGGGRSGGGF